ncbi:hypothetical protein SAM23877_5156 [Streptomyces ambofaciens ATCC 23877]|uniref:Uncharacterized protein n=1 Tax=Streptomyces ambofaciens (strain ATCC 23877 / 3486 / DSM 40053 / JCM 4204 / NBRC 12836 / NRRL B-2516) TaxID=278992 RepID=A0A0K2AZ70_STRA7|nr:hypothetical protein SAM23877_5156 [Streptomyces ambofaciens ATCC 23877]
MKVARRVGPPTGPRGGDAPRPSPPAPGPPPAGTAPAPLTRARLGFATMDARLCVRSQGAQLSDVRCLSHRR